MKATISEAMKRVKSLETKKERLLEKERREFTYSYLEDEKPLKSSYSFDETTKEIESIDSEVRHIKLCISKANATIKLENFDMTIAEGLVLLGQLQKRSTRLCTLSSIEDVTRIVTRSGKIEYTKTRENTEHVREEYDACLDMISSLQLALDKTNLSSTIEI